MRKLKLTIEYDGTGYVGWQRQPNGISVQGCVEEALNRVSGEIIKVVSSGRTDAGVHAREMVAHFEYNGDLPMTAFREGVNRYLPADIVITEAIEADPDFHARYSALAKMYRYSILQGDVRSPLHGRYSWHVKRPLDLDAMRSAARRLVGRHDFSAFRSSGCDAATTVRRIMSVEMGKDGRMLHIDIVGDGFLRNMVRVIVGTLVEIGVGKRGPQDISMLLEMGRRTRSGVTAPPHGLCLVKVWYDGLPTDWLPDAKPCKSSQKSLDK